MEQNKDQHEKTAGKTSSANGKKPSLKKAHPKKPSFKKPKGKWPGILDKKKEESELAQLKKELQDLNKSYRYLRAEMENTKKIHLKEKQKALQYGASNLIDDILKNVINDFNTAIEKPLDEQNLKQFKEGIMMIHKKLLKTLKENNVEEINPQGEIFDPHFHEVLGVEKKEDLPAQTILYVLRKGYKMKDRLVQAAQVIVSSKNEKDNE